MAGDESKLLRAYNEKLKALKRQDLYSAPWVVGGKKGLARRNQLRRTQAPGTFYAYLALSGGAVLGMVDGRRVLKPDRMSRLIAEDITEKRRFNTRDFSLTQRANMTKDRDGVMRGVCPVFADLDHVAATPLELHDLVEFGQKVFLWSLKRCLPDHALWRDPEAPVYAVCACLDEGRALRRKRVTYWKCGICSTRLKDDAAVVQCDTCQYRWDAVACVSDDHETLVLHALAGNNTTKTPRRFALAGGAPVEPGMACFADHGQGLLEGVLTHGGAVSVSGGQPLLDWKPDPVDGVACARCTPDVRTCLVCGALATAGAFGVYMCAAHAKPEMPRLTAARFKFAIGQIDGEPVCQACGRAPAPPASTAAGGTPAATPAEAAAAAASVADAAAAVAAWAATWVPAPGLTKLPHQSVLVGDAARLAGALDLGDFTNPHPVGTGILYTGAENLLSGHVGVFAHGDVHDVGYSNRPDQALSIGVPTDVLVTHRCEVFPDGGVRGFRRDQDVTLGGVTGRVEAVVADEQKLLVAFPEHHGSAPLAGPLRVGEREVEVLRFTPASVVHVWASETVGDKDRPALPAIGTYAVVAKQRPGARPTETARRPNFDAYSSSCDGGWVPYVGGDVPRPRKLALTKTGAHFRVLNNMSEARVMSDPALVPGSHIYRPEVRTVGRAAAGNQIKTTDDAAVRLFQEQGLTLRARLDRGATSLHSAVPLEGQAVFAEDRGAGTWLVNVDPPLPESALVTVELRGGLVGVAVAADRIRVLPDPSGASGSLLDRCENVNAVVDDMTTLRHRLVSVLHEPLVVAGGPFLTQQQLLVLRSMMAVRACKIGMFGTSDKDTWDEWLDPSVYRAPGLRVLHNVKMVRCPYCKGDRRERPICKALGNACNGTGKIRDPRTYHIVDVTSASATSMRRFVRELHVADPTRDRGRVGVVAQTLMLTSVSCEVPNHDRGCTNRTCDVNGCTTGECRHRKQDKGVALTPPTEGFIEDTGLGDEFRPSATRKRGQPDPTYLAHGFATRDGTTAPVSRANALLAKKARVGTVAGKTTTTTREMIFGGGSTSRRGARLAAAFTEFVATLGVQQWSDYLVVSRILRITKRKAGRGGMSTSTHEYWVNTNSTCCQIARRSHQSNQIKFRLVHPPGGEPVALQGCWDEECAKRPEKRYPITCDHLRTLAFGGRNNGLSFPILAMPTVDLTPGMRNANLDAHSDFCIAVAANFCNESGHPELDRDAIMELTKDVRANRRRTSTTTRKRREDNKPKDLIVRRPPQRKKPRVARRVVVCNRVTQRESIRQRYEILGLSPLAFHGCWAVLKQDGVFLPDLTGHEIGRLPCVRQAAAWLTPFTRDRVPLRAWWGKGRVVPLESNLGGVVTACWVSGPPEDGWARTDAGVWTRFGGAGGGLPLLLDDVRGGWRRVRAGTETHVVPASTVCSGTWNKRPVTVTGVFRDRVGTAQAVFGHGRIPSKRTAWAWSNLVVDPFRRESYDRTERAIVRGELLRLGRALRARDPDAPTTPGAATATGTRARRSASAAGPGRASGSSSGPSNSTGGAA